MKRLLVMCIFGLLIALPGCGGGNAPVNEGKDRPVKAPTPKKDKAE